ncbi:MAG: bifunctional serine/threonine-protein kinase/formylglycine-generating enzyme family protein [bacterium]
MPSGEESSVLQDSVLSRLSATSLSSVSSLTESQAQVDVLVGRFAEEATNWRSLAAMATGSLFYRFGRIGALALASRLPQAAPLFQAASYGVGLATEVAAFEGSSRFLAYASGDRSNANLWNWNGRGGWREGLAHSFVTFGMLKSVGFLAREQNVVLQHTVSDLAMVGGNQVAAAFGFGPRPEGNFASQMLEAEVTNLQLGAGMSLLHGVAPGLAAFERALDLTASSATPDFRASLSSLPDFSPYRPAYAEGVENSDSSVRSLEPQRGPTILQMTIDDGKKPGRGVDTLDAPPGLDPAAGVSQPLRRSPPPPPSPPGQPIVFQPGRKFGPDSAFPEGRYEVIRWYAQGGFGNIYLVRDHKLNRDVATKIPRENLYTQEHLDRFHREIQITSQLELDGESLATVLDLVTLPEGMTIPIMKFLPGDDLLKLRTQYYQRDRDVLRLYPLERRIEIFAEICKIVDSAHEQGVIHRDLKPGNIRILPDGRVVLLDWGRAINIHGEEVVPGEEDPSSHPKGSVHLTSPGKVMGTPGYIPPEAGLLLPPDSSPRSIDVFALGVILYEWMTGVHPFAFFESGNTVRGQAEKIPRRDPHGETQMNEVASFMRLPKNEPPPFRSVVTGEHPSYFFEMETIARKAFANDPKSRYSTARELREAVLMARAQVTRRRIHTIQEEIDRLREQAEHEWEILRHSPQVKNEAQWARMHDPLYAMVELRQEWRELARGVTNYLSGKLHLLSQPEIARGLIAEMNWLLLIDGGDRMPQQVREELMQTIRENDLPNEQGRDFGFARALEGDASLRLRVRDFFSGKGLAASELKVKIIPLVREVGKNGRETLNFREGQEVEFEGEDLRSLRLPAGYYIAQVSRPGYATARVPLEVTLDQVRQGLFSQGDLPWEVEMVPVEEVPEGFRLIHQGVATLGYNIFHGEMPTDVYSSPERKMPFQSFLAKEFPETVQEYVTYIEDRLNTINVALQKGNMERVRRILKEVREAVPRAQATVPDALPEDLSKSFEGLNLYWRIRSRGSLEERNLRFFMEDPTSHPDPNGDPMRARQPINAISYLGGESYARWLSRTHGVRYEIASAEQEEIMARSALPFPYPWGYRFNPFYVVSRSVFSDLIKGTYPQDVGTHPLGQGQYRDYSLVYGIRDLIGNVRRSTSTQVEPDTPASESTPAQPGTIFVKGGSLRVLWGPFFRAGVEAHVRKNIADASMGGFRLVVNLTDRRYSPRVP